MIVHKIKQMIEYFCLQNIQVLVLCLVQLVIIILFCLYVVFDQPINQVCKENLKTWFSTKAYHQDDWNTSMPLFNDVHVMVFLGIGFILTFLQNYSLTALSFNLLIGALSVQIHILGKLNWKINHWFIVFFRIWISSSLFWKIYQPGCFQRSGIYYKDQSKNISPCWVFCSNSSCFFLCCSGEGFSAPACCDDSLWDYVLLSQWTDW